MWLWEQRGATSVHVWPIITSWTSSIQSASVSVLVLASDSDWLAAVANWSLGPTPAEEDDWTWVRSSAVHFPEFRLDRVSKMSVKKVNVAHTRLPSIGFQSWSWFLAVSLCDVSHKPGGRLPLLSARPAVTPSTLKSAATNFAAWWTRAQWVWTVCLRLLPDSIPTAIWTRAFCAWVQHANHSATEPPRQCQCQLKIFLTLLEWQNCYEVHGFLLDSRPLLTSPQCGAEYCAELQCICLPMSLELHQTLLHVNRYSLPLTALRYIIMYTVRLVL